MVSKQIRSLTKLVMALCQTKLYIYVCIPHIQLNGQSLGIILCISYFFSFTTALCQPWKFGVSLNTCTRKELHSLTLAECLQIDRFVFCSLSTLWMLIEVKHWKSTAVNTLYNLCCGNHHTRSCLTSMKVFIYCKRTEIQPQDLKWNSYDPSLKILREKQKWSVHCTFSK